MKHENVDNRPYPKSYQSIWQKEVINRCIEEEKRKWYFLPHTSKISLRSTTTAEKSDHASLAALISERETIETSGLSKRNQHFISRKKSKATRRPLVSEGGKSAEKLKTGNRKKKKKWREREASYTGKSKRSHQPKSKVTMIIEEPTYGRHKISNGEIVTEIKSMTTHNLRRNNQSKSVSAYFWLKY